MDNNFNNPDMQNGNNGMNPNMQNGNWNNGTDPNMQNGNWNNGMDPNMQNGNWNNGMDPNMQNGNWNNGMDPNMQNGNNGMNPNGNEQPQKKKSSKVGTILSGIFLVLIAGVVLYIGGIDPMLKKSDAKSLDAAGWTTISSGDYVSVTAHYGSDELFEITSTVNLIPIGKEHYYMVVNEDFTNCVVVRAGSGWFDENFTEVEGVGIAKKPLELKGKVKLVDTKGRSYMSEQMQAMAAYGVIPASNTLYIDLLSEQYSIYTFLCCGVGILLWILSVFVVRKMAPNSAGKTILAGIIGVLAFADLAFAIHVLQFIM